MKCNQTYNTKFMFKQTKLNQKKFKLHFSLSQFPYENQPTNQNRFEYSYELKFYPKHYPEPTTYYKHNHPRSVKGQAHNFFQILDSAAIVKNSSLHINNCLIEPISTCSKQITATYPYPPHIVRRVSHSLIPHAFRYPA